MTTAQAAPGLADARDGYTAPLMRPDIYLIYLLLRLFGLLPLRVLHGIGAAIGRFSAWRHSGAAHNASVNLRIARPGLDDAAHAPIEVSLRLLEPLHERWVRLLHSVKSDEFARTFRHPYFGVKTLDWMLFLYAWHGKHHTTHITELRKKKGW